MAERNPLAVQLATAKQLFALNAEGKLALVDSATPITKQKAWDEVAAAKAYKVLDAHS